MTYAPDELALPELPMFPAEGTLDVCPTGAIEWLPDTATGPRVKEDECIGCALCVSRCPLGAVHVGASGKAHVSDTATPQIRDARAALSVDQAKAERARFARARQEGALVAESDAVIERTYAHVRAFQGAAPRLPTLLTRNLLLGLGWHAAMRRLGDTNVRMDVVAGHEGRLCAAEVEFSDAVVDAPRNVLDDLAVLIARYDHEKSSVMGLVVALSLPNQRSEYWLVMENIAEVLEVRVGTVTIGVLLLLLWNRRSLGAEPPSAIAGSHSIRASAETLLGRRARLTLGCESALESAK